MKFDVKQPWIIPIDERIQIEIRIAKEMQEQHPDVSRDEALCAAARAVDRHQRDGTRPA